MNSTCRGAVRELPSLVAELGVNNLWISGDKDQVMEPGYVRDLAAYSSHHDYREISSCGHLAMREQPDQLRRMLIEWMAAQSLANPRS